MRRSSGGKMNFSSVLISRNKNLFTIITTTVKFDDNKSSFLVPDFECCRWPIGGGRFGGFYGFSDFLLQPIVASEGAPERESFPVLPTAHRAERSQWVCVTSVQCFSNYDEVTGGITRGQIWKKKQAKLLIYVEKINTYADVVMLTFILLKFYLDLESSTLFISCVLLYYASNGNDL